MSDDDRRALERRAAETRDSDTCRRLARVCERAGDRRAALAALLLGATSDVELRREAARFEADEPVRRAPRVAWTTKPDGRDQLINVIANPLAVVTFSKQRTLVLDPVTGAIRKQLLPAHSHVLASEVLILFHSNLTLAGYDLVTGEELFAKRIQGTAAFGTYADRTLVTGYGHDVVGVRFEDERRAPAVAWRWRDRMGVAAIRPAISGDLVVVHDGRELVALDAATGKERFRVPGERCDHLDALGLVTVEQHGRTIVTGLFTRAGERVASVQGVGPIAASRDHVVAHDGEALVFLDRATGKQLGRATGPRAILPHVCGGTCASVLAATVVECLDARGRSQWRWAPRRGRVLFLAGTPWSLNVLVGRSIVRLEEPSA